MKTITLILSIFLTLPAIAQYQAELDTTCNNGVATITGTWIGDARDKGTFSLLAYVGASGVPWGDARTNPIAWNQGPYDASLVANLDTATLEIDIDRDTWWQVPTCYMLEPTVQYDFVEGFPSSGMHPLIIENNFCPINPLHFGQSEAQELIKNRFDGLGPFYHFTTEKFTRFEKYENLPNGWFVFKGRKFHKIANN